MRLNRSKRSSKRSAALDVRSEEPLILVKVRAFSADIL
jgi:hypothetical protein